MTEHEAIRLFGMKFGMLKADLARLEEKHNIDLGLRKHASDRDEEDYYPQFEEVVRREAAAMSRHYEIFYCLEKSIRTLVREKFIATHGAAWWTTKVPEPVRKNAEQNMKREAEAGVTARSNEPLDYTTFGELGEIVRSNWSDFVDTFDNDKAFTKIMTSLNVIRGPIAHCSPLAQDEVDRLRLTLRDWFRQMA